MRDIIIECRQDRSGYVRDWWDCLMSSAVQSQYSTMKQEERTSGEVERLSDAVMMDTERMGSGATKKAERTGRSKVWTHEAEHLPTTPGMRNA
ncbi:hypothetical protein ANO11243_018580 [Dothideomycetidae sp. 11243]|nr:hypothetical protein ANO11243_018580 [fungal sp. No.11243]